MSDSDEVMTFPVQKGQLLLWHQNFAAQAAAFWRSPKIIAQKQTERLRSYFRFREAPDALFGDAEP